MHFLGIEIGHGGTRAVALNLESSMICAEASAPHDWIKGLPASNTLSIPFTPLGSSDSR